LGTEVIGPDLGDVNVLRGVDEEAPPENLEPDEENSSIQSVLVG